jgi:putative methionine-R-sulfoxide reductase with GAF domain
VSVPLSVRLEDIPSAFEGVIPSAICTVADDGTPNVTYLSVVHHVDDDHVALSRQFFKKTDENTIVNPLAQVLMIEPETGRLFALDLVYERTETEGALFERMRTRLDAVAAHEGMHNVFRLKGTDVCRVESCRLLPGFPAESQAPPRRDVKISRVEEFSSQLASVEDMDELLATVLRACEELLGYPHVFVMLVDESGERLYTVASAGFPSSGAGSEVRIGEGLIGVAAERKRSVRVTHMARDLSYSHAAQQPAGAKASPVERVIPLPRLHAAQSQLVTPMLAHRALVGVLCLQSETPGAFQSADEYVAGILANQVAMAMAHMRRSDSAPDARASGTRAVEVKHYTEDDSVFLDNEYLIKGVAGGILWRLLCYHEEHGRSEFSNKEIRLDSSLDLPDIKDNLEARLILLRKRLAERTDYLRIEKVARGRFRLDVERPLNLVQVGGGGPL